MRQVDFGFNALEFNDRHGVIRQTWGCSLLGRGEFFTRLNALLEQLQKAPQDSTIAALYESDQFFRHNCDRCLALNNIDPDWLDNKGVMLTSFLFTHDGKGALLVDLNHPDPPPPELVDDDEDGEPGTVWDAIASLWGAEEDLQKAMKIAEEMPAKQVEPVLRARVKQSIPKEEREKRKRDKLLREAAKDYDLSSVGKIFKGVA